MSAASSAPVDQARARVQLAMQLHYGKSLDELEISDTPGYWQDKQARVHPGHPLHGCLGCDGPFKATYPFTDASRDPLTGRWLSPVRSWQLLHAAARASTLR